MNQLHVNLLGKFVARHTEKAPISFSSYKEKEVFCFLVAKRHPHSREALASLLWEDTTTKQSKKYLRTALWKLRSDLGCSSRVGADRWFSTDDGWIQLCPRARIWSDTSVLEQAFELLRGAVGDNLNAQEEDVLKKAVDLYRGAFLEGWYQAWCLHERERFYHMYMRLANKLMLHFEYRRNFDHALSLGLSLLEQDPVRESTHRSLMRLHYLAGNRCSALRQYDRCVEVLREELDVAPSRLTQSLHKQIRLDRLSGLPAEPATAEQPLVHPRPALHSALGDLRKLQETLENVQRLLQQEVRQSETSSK